jgi:hypothetical protein
MNGENQMNALTTSFLSKSHLQGKSNAAPRSRAIVGAKVQPTARGGVKEFFAVLLRSLGTSAA